MGASERLTSFNGLFARDNVDPDAVTRIEIPLIQRDYAQGRNDAVTKRIRDGFLGSLRGAIVKGPNICLDFIYGYLKAGKLEPLDGQQRLTALFLLHWYLAFKAECMDQFRGRKCFSYATRPSARIFCAELVEHQPPAGERFTSESTLSCWIKNQPWYLYTWQYDPTVESMLVVLDAIDDLFGECDCVAAWGRLTDAVNPAVSFYLLPMGEESGLNDDLYIKMNSRGKLLTPFEHFKAEFGEILNHAGRELADRFAEKIDGKWLDVFWDRKSGDTTDEQILRYFHFVTDVCQWRADQLADGDTFSLAERFRKFDIQELESSVRFVFRAFNIWTGVDIPTVFGDLFTKEAALPDADDSQKVVLFFESGSNNLFADCCQGYGSGGKFSQSETLLLYAVILHLDEKGKDGLRWLRIVRNLIAASGDEIRPRKMPDLITDVYKIVVEQTLEGLKGFNKDQIEDEKRKLDFLKGNPNLEQPMFRLEDHSLLRGCLAAFELDEKFESRAVAFHRVFSGKPDWLSITGALLAKGDYSHSHNNNNWYFRFGSSSGSGPWRGVLTDIPSSEIAATRGVVCKFLDAVSEARTGVEETLSRIRNGWVDRRFKCGGLDWIWYFVKYEVMRKGNSGIYAGSKDWFGYNVCMLRRTQTNGFYLDPYLSAILMESGKKEAVKGIVRVDDRDDRWFRGYEKERWLELEKSGMALRCAKEGFVLKSSKSSAYERAFDEVCARYTKCRAGADQIVGNPPVRLVTLVIVDERQIDKIDRVEFGAKLLNDLVEAESAVVL